MDLQVLEALLPYLTILLLLLLGLIAGSLIESRHIASIREREERFRGLPTITFEEPPADWRIDSSGLVAGNIVVSLDYFKRFAASLKMIVGGRVRAFEPLLDRGRREALLRMKQQASEQGYDAIINVRLETSRIANADGNTTAGVEMLAYGTAIRLVGGKPLPQGADEVPAA